VPFAVPLDASTVWVVLTLSAESEVLEDFRRYVEPSRATRSIGSAVPER
jgi:hypothetical protein